MAGFSHVCAAGTPWTRRVEWSDWSTAKLNATETACHSTPQEAGLRIETLSFERIPQQTRLFLDYLRDPISLRRFYPEVVRNHFDLPARAERVLHAQQTNRSELCDALERLNRN